MPEARSDSAAWWTVGVLVLLLVMALAVIADLYTRPSGGLSIPRGSHAVDVVLRNYSIQAPASLPSGNYEFVVTNRGTVPHELVMWSTKDRAANLPLAKNGGVNEESSALDSVLDSGSALAPGESRILYADLTAPGHYALVCNLPTHYRLGMHTDLTVS